ncbi:hypothetical protein A9G34_02345 [Gilliamella sp. Choc4-2]|jgi:peptidoglycan/LPS O-acetylase OafA/YrhL|uniref:acyltransferase family protein n=1 Tax=unclassified Gilliamella TaxID=2685620 RepID=UPI0004DCC055|nr:acyltransferase [Gilliamella apicola]KFA59933.1 acyltransferase 3 [Gilliamella apicola]OCG30258.1 hypothetical protein A9G33_07780 [Gilliamella apicola]OCG47198.1 hypothetical protein A9G34_02345 [Gilliamella apicola]OCG55332.1 hypothetical protein A9G36_05065 [Gilliamella apicola]OCG61640.1 hypothetical protein A9G48_10090 [Gilliamella apicola]
MNDFIHFYDLLAIILSPFLFIAILNLLLPKSIKENVSKDENKYTSIDGLRGISAIFVFISHSLLSWRYFFVDGGWINNTPLLIFDKNLNEQIAIGFLSLGGLGVSFFFMITGFLFFDQLLRNKGKINIIKFFIKRFFRIAPLYYFVIALVFITVFLTGIPEFPTLKKEIQAFLSWTTFGLSNIKTISALIPTSLVVAGVLWTLAIEWKFYACVPILSIFTRTKLTAILFVFCGIAITIVLFNLGKIKDIRLFLPFFFGMLASLFVNNYLIPLKSGIIKSPITSLFILVFFLFAVFKLQFGYSGLIFQSALGLIFILIASNNSVFGLLKSKIFITLGKLSYSFYLIHGLVLFLINGVIMKSGNFLLNSLVSMLITLLISIFTYYFIERIGINFGHKITKN